VKQIIRRALIGLLCGIVSSPFLCLALRSVGLGPALGALLGIARAFAFFDLGIIVLLFAMLFRYLPDAKVAWRDVWTVASGIRAVSVSSALDATFSGQQNPPNLCHSAVSPVYATMSFSA